MIHTLEWTEVGVRFLDQTKLPTEEVYVTCINYQQVADAIRTMIVRGAPAIGVAAAMGVALGMRDAPARDHAELRRTFEASQDLTIDETRQALIEESKRMHVEDIVANKAMGKHGAKLLPPSGGILTHCNAGALATCGYGTALGVIRAAVEAGKKLHVFADETRPFLQGSRLTAWELTKDHIPTTVISDNMAGAMMSQGKIDAVVVGADRIAANGDVANKIGTYTVAVLAKEHGIPFYVAAPWSTVDLATAEGKDIPIEQRSPAEVTHFAGKRVTPEGIRVENPAFDVTPNRYVSAIITERGVVRPPFQESLEKLASEFLIPRSTAKVPAR